MRGVGDFGRGGAGLGGEGEDLRGRAGTDGGAARSGRDAFAADTGLGGGARDPRGRDGRSEDFRGRLADALGGADRAGRTAKRGSERSEEAQDGGIPTGAAGLLSLFQPRAPAAAAEGEAASPAGVGRPAGRHSAAPTASAEAGDPSSAGRGAAAEPAPEKKPLRVLAASEPDAASLLAAQPAPAFRAGDVDVAEAERPGAIQADRVAARLEEALQADASVGGPVTIAVPVAPGMDGLAGVSVTVNAGGLDVVLDRVAGAAVSDELAAAARDLVSRLQKRFPRGGVRVLEASRPDASDATRPGAGWTPA